MVNNKLVAVSEKVHGMINSLKIIPKEPYGDCLERVLEEYRVLKRQEEVREQIKDVPLVPEDNKKSVPYTQEPSAAE